MGGHGAVLACMKHQDIFGACGSMSGVLDLRMSVNNGKIKVFGEYSKNKSLWDDNSVREQLYRLYRRDMPAMIIDCGTEDPLFRTNEKCHQDMMDMQLPHEYIVRPGKHNHAYWNNAVDTHIAFFLKHFSKK
jgi:S-formylglutathione hydrolase FrmB